MHLKIIPTGTTDISVKMSTQTEIPIKIADETFAAIEENVTNGIETDLPPLEISKDFVLQEEEEESLLQEEEEENLNTKTLCSENNVLDSVMATGDILENFNGDVCDPITDETLSQNRNEFECKTRDLEISNEIHPTKPDVHAELCKLDNSSETQGCETELENKHVSITDEPNSVSNKTLLEDTSDDLICTEVSTPVVVSKNDKINTDHTMNEEICKPSEITDDSEIPDTEDSNSAKDVELIMTDPKSPHDEAMDKNKLSRESVDKILDIKSNKTVEEKITDGSCSVDTEDLNINKDVELIIADSKYPNDDEINDKKDNSRESVDATLGNKSNKICDEEEEFFGTIDNDDILMGDISKISDEKIVSELQSSNDTENDEEVLPLVQSEENVIPSKVKDSTPIEIVLEKSMPLQADENVISMEVENENKEGEEYTKSMEIDEEVFSTVNETTNMILPQANEPILIDIPEDNLPSVQENSNSNQSSENSENTQNLMIEPSIIPANITDSGIEISKEFFSEVKSKINENSTFLPDTAQSCTENKVLNDEKRSDNVSMETNVEAENVEKDNQEKNSNEDSQAITNGVTSTIAKYTSKITAVKTIVEDVVLDNNEHKGIPESKLLSNSVLGNEENKNTIVEDVVLDNSEDKNITESEVLSNSVLEKEENKKIHSTENLPDNESSAIENQNASKIIETNVSDTNKDSHENVEIIDEDDVKILDLEDETTKTPNNEESSEQDTKKLPVVCKLSNTLDILSDDDDEVPNIQKNESKNTPEEKQCINLDDDDDIMLIEEDPTSKDKSEASTEKEEAKPSENIDEETGEKHTTDITDLMPKTNEKDTSDNISMDLDSAPEIENKPEEEEKPTETKKPLLSSNFLKTAKKNLAGMTRHELEDFCILRIVESIVDRSNLSDIKTKMKTMVQNLEDFKKRATMMAKQNRDLQVVLKSVQEEQKKRTNVPIQPLKITRSVGMQVLMNDKLDPRRKAPIPNPVPPPAGPSGRLMRGIQCGKPIKPLATPPNIPVPRKVPVSNSPAKTVTNTPTNNLGNKPTSPHPNGLRNPSPVQKVPEKRALNRNSTSVTVDLTDDEPPTKVTKNSPSQPVRVVPPQNLLAQQRQFAPLNNARKVYIPISGPQAQQIRAGQTIVMKNIVPQGPRPGQRVPLPRPQSSPIRPKQTASRHPAPLPESMKQYTPPNWKALPPAPDLKLSKVENGIVISWKIDGYHEGAYETIASYQLYAYQETSAPPCTALWKKIGDVKALPLPMACTLTQFMAGFKYYFAVRAVDVRSRLGPFSLPGSILLLNKV